MADVEPKQVRARGGHVIIRAAAISDAEAILAHRRRHVISTPHTVSELDELPGVDGQRTWIEEHLASPGRLALVAEVLDQDDSGTGEIIGTLSFRSGGRRRIAHQGGFGIGVDTEWRGQGIGAAMIEVLLDWATAHPLLEKVQLGVFASNEGARRLYERMGFVEEGRQVRFAKSGPNSYEDDVLMCIFVKEWAAADGFRIWKRQ